MAVRTDPEGNESTALFALAEFDGAEVLEIGCGDGRLTWRYADRTAHVTAIDPFANGIARANHWLPERLQGIVDFRQAAFEAFAAHSDPDVFDITILSWSLC
jgi:2-polyprenyl-3-methyl-5-hydroxy-6-metoxy-1,4-benzoquinol methylase